MYTIYFLNGNESQRSKVLLYLSERMIKEGKFRAQFHLLTIKGQPAIGIKPVRLVKAKEYCGQHAGTCQINVFTGKLPKKPRAHYLEFSDWIKFHNFVNRVLNRFHVHANVWSTPLEVRGKMWIRKDLKPRLKWDYTTEYDSYGRAIHHWNLGTPDQFL